MCEHLSLRWNPQLFARKEEVIQEEASALQEIGGLYAGLLVGGRLTYDLQYDTAKPLTERSLAHLGTRSVGDPVPPSGDGRMSRWYPSQGECGRCFPGTFPLVRFNQVERAWSFKEVGGNSFP
jgi:hypothetical protein